jgi:hypothetical protein
MKAIYRSALSLLFIGIVIAAVFALTYRPMVREPFTGPKNRILNRLRQIDGAKELWRVDHLDKHPQTFSEQDLAPYLSHDFWKQAVAGERYLLHGLGEPPEALITKDVDGIPSGMKLRFGPDPDGKIEIRPGQDPAKAN